MKRSGLLLVSMFLLTAAHGHAQAAAARPTALRFGAMVDGTGRVLRDAVIVAKDAEGHTTVRETMDPQPGQTALSSAMWTGLLGLIFGGPVGWLVGGAVGAGVGAVTAKVIYLGVPDEWVTWFRESVQPSTTTVILLLEIGRAHV